MLSPCGSSTPLYILYHCRAGGGGAGLFKTVFLKLFKTLYHCGGGGGADVEHAVDSHTLRLVPGFVGKKERGAQPQTSGLGIVLVLLGF